MKKFIKLSSLLMVFGVLFLNYSNSFGQLESTQGRSMASDGTSFCCAKTATGKCGALECEKM